MNHDNGYWDNPKAWIIKRISKYTLELKRNEDDFKYNNEIEASYYSCDYPVETFYDAAAICGFKFTDESDGEIMTDGYTKWRWVDIDFDRWYQGGTIYLNSIN